ncbi:OpgC domain-containing protein [Stigmatella sp. ncwal1]|uniref:OpgC domain-containing protein n=1 Tax=Stigmatella ashevillensis TaxID=2995309 RepID=A0ABT5D7U3_9BACT|nr:OpgC domain-containing protein [Stigmatella ashevillena]MDC0709736.1 OpgC domain-containing protein [Stigmatella ashevillena]
MCLAPGTQDAGDRAPAETWWEMQRLEVLDGLRGYFLVFMVLNHLTFAGGYLLVKLNHGELGYVQDAPGFVFLSGLLLGQVYGARMQKHGYRAGASKIYHRAFELYRYTAGCLLAIIALGFLLTESSVYWEPWLWRLAQNDWGFALAAAALLYQPTYMDILPQYIVYLALSPRLVWLCVTGRWRKVAIGSLLLWLGVQFGVHLPLASAIDAVMGALHTGLVLRAHFNVLAWQIVFMGGLVLGCLTSIGQLDWRRVFDPARRGLVEAALCIVVFFMIWRLGMTWELFPEAMQARLRTLEVRAEFSMMFLLNFAALSYLVGWLIIGGVRSDSAWARRAGEGLRALFTLPFLRLLGRHSLQVYVWHVLVIYLLKAVDYHHGPFNELTKTAIAASAVASLALPALLKEHRTAAAAVTAEP